jgi:hypothetical protein
MGKQLTISENTNVGWKNKKDVLTILKNTQQPEEFSMEHFH